MVGIPAPEVDASVLAALHELAVGGVILFKRNVESPRQLRALTKALHALPSRPLISIDQEGGRVARLRAPFTELPPAAVVGRKSDLSLYSKKLATYETGDQFDHEAAQGFIRLWGLGQQTQARQQLLKGGKGFELPGLMSK